MLTLPFMGYNICMREEMVKGSFETSLLYRTTIDEIPDFEAYGCTWGEAYAFGVDEVKMDRCKKRLNSSVSTKLRQQQ